MDKSISSAHRAAREATPDVLPASQYLQEKLQERRARNMRPKRTRQSDFGPRRTSDDDIFLNEAEESKRAASRAFDSSPLGPMLRRGSEMGDSNGRKRGAGVKDMTEQMDRLTKQNFALKLELDNRREFTAKLQEQIDSMRLQVERAEQLEQEHAELLRINSQLVEELENRDKAVEEAMDIICDLEDTVADIQERHSVTRPSTANADSGYAGTETHEQMPPSSPPVIVRPPKTAQVAQRQPPPAASAAAHKLLSAVGSETPARPRREPHILSQKKPSTQALRSVYLGTAQALKSVQSFNSLLTKRESQVIEDDALLDSPRLSVLSESSFPSLYSPKDQLSPDRRMWDADEVDMSPAHLRQDSIKRVSQWMEDGEIVDETPSKSNRLSPPIMQFPSADALSSPLRRPVDTSQFRSLGKTLSNGSSTSTKSSIEACRGVSYVKPYPIRTARQLSRIKAAPDSFAGPMFGEPLLPPTPDSASTRMLRASRSSIAEEDRSLLDTTPQPLKGFDALQPDIRTAPRQFRSSLELRSAFQSHESRLHREHDELQGDLNDEAVTDSPLLDYDGFPDGSSLKGGTPSRFRTQPLSPSQLRSYVPNLNPGLSNHPVPRRRQSSSEVTVSPRKPGMTRAETSPTIYTTLGNAATSEQRSSSSGIASPRSQYSGSSGNRTVVQSVEQPRNISPEPVRTRSALSHSVAPPSRSRTSPSPARTLSQKTHAFFGRIGNTARDNNADGLPGGQQQREKSPLPTLTSTPSSAYVNDLPKEYRRPGTAQGSDTRPGSRSDGRRPALPMRTATAPTSPGRAESTERKNLFRRRGSVRHAEASTPTPLTLTPANGVVTTIVTAGSEQKGSSGISCRRGSFRDAVGSAARRPWR